MGSARKDEEEAAGGEAVQASTSRGLEDRAQFTVVHQAPWAQLSAALLRSDALPRTVVCSLLAGADDTSAVWGSGSRRRQLQLVDLFFQTSVAVFPVPVQLQQFLVRSTFASCLYVRAAATAVDAWPLRSRIYLLQMDAGTWGLTRCPAPCRVGSGR